MIDEPILQPIYDLETPRMAFGRVAIIGDAAFVARPHVAAGVAKAADDAAALVAALANDEVEPALASVRGRAPSGRAAHHRARAPSRRLPAGDADRRGARPLATPQHSARRCWRRRRCSISCGRDADPAGRARCADRHALAVRCSGGATSGPSDAQSGYAPVAKPAPASEPIDKHPLRIFKPHRTLAVLVEVGVRSQKGVLLVSRQCRPCR